ncbi:hypothetical protein [Filomicrobium sp.]|uniref:hypothetical protein n=1 Tax=Filomicrobium sp. TaxID=2024831 RepID=UPI002588DD91|nr:hypothetical protein [Filomicrobium sp.]MCV0371017.1 hypothetical protein [Filomicrobium sp.]
MAAVIATFLATTGIMAAATAWAGPPGQMQDGSPTPATQTEVPAANTKTPEPGSDWPCVQRKIDTLTSAQIWDGPPVEEIKNWRDDKEIAELVSYVISRRIEMDAVEEAIKNYAEKVPEAERDKKLTLLFAGVLHETNVVRSSVVNGIETFQRRQRARAKRLEEQGKELAALHDRAAKGEKISQEIDTLQNHYDWNARVFKERQDNLPLACEIPVLIEQRAFAVARAIRSHMND